MRLEDEGENWGGGIIGFRELFSCQTRVPGKKDKKKQLNDGIYTQIEQ